MSSVNSVCHNFESMSNHKTIYGLIIVKKMCFYTVNLRFDENKNKFTSEDSLDPFLNNDFIIMENVHLYTISKPI